MAGGSGRRAGLNLRGGRRREEPEINLTPLIDVVFLLLIFFMVTTTFVRQAGLEITLPEADAERSEPPPETLELAVDAEGEYYVGDQALVNRQRATLIRALEEALAEREITGIVVRADADAPHRAVVRALDAAGQVGIERVSIAALPPEEVADE